MHDRELVHGDVKGVCFPNAAITSLRAAYLLRR